MGGVDGRRSVGGQLAPVSLIGGVSTSLMRMKATLAHGNPGVAVALDQSLRR